MSQIRQQVNLYQAQFHPHKEKLTIAQCLIFVFAVAGVFAVLSWMKIEQVNDIEGQLSGLEERHKMMMAQLSKLAVASNSSKKKAVKEADITEKEADLKARRELLGTLTDGKYGSTDGFSDYLLALSRQHVEGAWITGLSVSDGGKKLTVAGKTLQPELAPIYLQNLANEQVFSGKSFSVMELNRQGRLQEDGEPGAVDEIEFIFSTGKEDVSQITEDLVNGF